MSKNIKGTKNKKENKRDFGKIATRVMAVVLALLMILSVATTLIYYLIAA